MAITKIQKGFAPIKKYFPSFIANFIRSVFTAILTPLKFSRETGHFKSSFLMKSVDRKNRPIPWYTYPSYDFLRFKDYTGRSILEFGGGQSTLWWAERADYVLTFEGNQKEYDWFGELKSKVPANVDLCYVPLKTWEESVSSINNDLEKMQHPKFDVAVIDGLARRYMVSIAADHLKEGGIIVCDNAAYYGFYDEFQKYDFDRIDFYGYAPGVVLPHCTCILFKKTSFVFDKKNSIEVVAKSYS